MSKSKQIKEMIDDTTFTLRKRIAELEAKVFEMGNHIGEHGCDVIKVKEENAKLRAAADEAEKALMHAEQLCTWLCEDSNRYPGTDPGNAAKWARQMYREALAAIRGEK